MSNADYEKGFDFQVFNLDDIQLGLGKSFLRKEIGEYTGGALFEKWLARAKRQSLWLKANALIDFIEQIEKTPNVKFNASVALATFFTRLQTQIKVCHEVNLNKTISGIETQAFGHLITRSEQAHYRLNFWRMVQMVFEGVTPSDLEVTLDCDAQLAGEYEMKKTFQQFVRENRLNIEAATSEEERTLHNQNLTLVTSRHNQRDMLFNNKHSILTGEQSQQIRQWAHLYYLAGYTPNDMCSLMVRENHQVYLSRPVLQRYKDSFDPQKQFHTLAWWSNYGIRGMKDIRRYPNHKAALDIPEVFLDDLDEMGEATSFASRRHISSSFRSEAEKAFKAWSQSKMPLIALVTEEMPVPPLRYPDQLLKQSIDDIELKHFKKVVTKGSDNSRIRFWGTMNTQYAKRLKTLYEEIPSHDVYGRAYIAEMAITAHGLIIEGELPTTSAVPVAYGRAGVATYSEDLEGKPLIHYINNHLEALNKQFDTGEDRVDYPFKNASF